MNVIQVDESQCCNLPSPAQGLRADHRSPGHQYDGASLAEILVVRSATKWLRLWRYANRLLKLQNELLQTLERRRRGNSQSITVKHVHIHPGGQGVVGIVNRSEDRSRGEIET